MDEAPSLLLRLQLKWTDRSVWSSAVGLDGALGNEPGSGIRWNIVDGLEGTAKVEICI